MSVFKSIINKPIEESVVGDIIREFDNLGLDMYKLFVSLNRPLGGNLFRIIGDIKSAIRYSHGEKELYIISLNLEKDILTI